MAAPIFRSILIKAIETGMTKLINQVDAVPRSLIFMKDIWKAGEFTEFVILMLWAVHDKISQVLNSEVLIPKTDFILIAPKIILNNFLSLALMSVRLWNFKDGGS